ncbi:MAG TPA: Fic family protein [Solirubrobacterales bacterium]|nr:Fic family protein [Solirubrobacterales bacterium]
MTDRYAFHASFTKYTAKATNALGRVAAARAQIETSEIRPAVEDELRVSALAETVHYSTLIEGNELPIVEAERAARGSLDSDTKAKIELVDYVEALHYLDGLAEGTGIEISPETILALHKKTTNGLGSEDSPHFKPHHEGAWREGIAQVVDRATGAVMHEGAPPDEVPGRMAGLCAWITEREDRTVDFPPPVIAGVVHYAVTDIHPFADGNGRVARLLSAAVLMRMGFISRRLFSFERYYAEDRDAYYAALRSVRAETLNMNTWLEYFLGGLAEEYERAAARIGELQAIGLGSNAKIELNASQERGLLQLNFSSFVEFRRADYESIAEVSRSTAARDLRDLEEKHLVVRRGKGAAARYRLRSPIDVERRGRKRTWTDERIEHELREIWGEREDWPSVDEFRLADSLPLYEAIRRHGGSRSWAERLGWRRKTVRGRPASDD